MELVQIDWIVRDGDRALPMELFVRLLQEGRKRELERVSLSGTGDLSEYRDTVAASGVSLVDPPPCAERLSGANPDRACSHYRTSCAISADGDVFPCLGLPIPLGNTRETSLAEILEESELRNELLHIADWVKKPCASCENHASCTGCRGTAYRQTGDFFGADPGCPLLAGRDIPKLPTDARNVLPHPGRAVYLQRICSLFEKGGTAAFTVPANCDLLRDGRHLDESALVELMAQACGALHGFQHERWESVSSGGVVGVNQFHCSRLIRVGEEVVFHVHKKFVFDTFTVVDLDAVVGNETVASASIKLFEGAI